MPQYKDGTEAKVGDQVFGKLYNTPGVRAGTIISITPGVDSCNAQVQYSEVVPVDGKEEVPRMAIATERGGRKVKTESHGASGPEAYVFQCADYCATGDLTKIGP